MNTSTDPLLTLAPSAASAADLAAQAQPLPYALPMFKIKTKMTHASCEDCGSYSRGTARIKHPFGDVLEADYDGHFGGGCWDGEESTLHLWCLQLLGVEVRIDGETVSGQPYLEEQDLEECDPDTDRWMIVDLYARAPARRVVDFTWNNTDQIRWTAADDTPRALTYDENALRCDAGYWDGSEEQLFRLLLDERAQIIYGL